MVTNRYKSSPA